MNLSELEQILIENDVPSSYYNLTGIGRIDERIVLIKTVDKWEVFYQERGIKTTDLFFETESDACIYIAKKLIKK